MRDSIESKFGACADGRFSPHWVLSVRPDAAEVYVSAAVGFDFHASLHQSGDWHLKAKVRKRPEVTSSWRRPSEWSPGFIRALEVKIDPSVVVGLEEAPGVIWMTADETRRNCFNVFLEHPDANRSDSWPAKNTMNTSLVCRMPLADGWTVVVTHHLEPREGGSVRANVRPKDRSRAEAMFAEPGSTYVLATGKNDADGSVSILHTGVSVTPGH